MKCGRQWQIPTSVRVWRRVFAAISPPQAAEEVIAFLQTVPDVHPASRQDPERLQAAAFVLLEDDLKRIPQVQQILARDWRDLLVWAKLGHSDWPDRLNEMLGPLH
jgi:hypothetical protein